MAKFHRDQASGREAEAQPLGGRVYGRGRGEMCWEESQLLRAG